MKSLHGLSRYFGPQGFIQSHRSHFQSGRQRKCVCQNSFDIIIIYNIILASRPFYVTKCKRGVPIISVVMFCQQQHTKGGYRLQFDGDGGSKRILQLCRAATTYSSVLSHRTMDDAVDYSCLIFTQVQIHLTMEHLHHFIVLTPHRIDPFSQSTPILFLKRLLFIIHHL